MVRDRGVGHIRTPELPAPVPELGTMSQAARPPAPLHLGLMRPCERQPRAQGLGPASPPTDGAFVDAPVTA